MPFCYVRDEPMETPMGLAYWVCYHHKYSDCEHCPLRTSYLHAEAMAWDPLTNKNHTACFRYFRHIYNDPNKDEAYYSSLIASIIESCDNAKFGPIRFPTEWPWWKRILHRLL